MKYQVSNKVLMVISVALFLIACGFSLLLYFDVSFFAVKEADSETVEVSLPILNWAEYSGLSKTGNGGIIE